MNKTTLANKWSKYANTNQMVDDIASLLTTYNHPNTEFGICAMLDTYFTNKEPLIQMFARSKHYAGNMRIILPKETLNRPDTSMINRFCSTFFSNVNAQDLIIKYRDENNKTRDDYFKTGRRTLNIAKLCDTDVVSTMHIRKEKLAKFNSGGQTKESENNYKQSYALINSLSRYSNPYITEMQAARMNDITDNIKVHTNAKTSRVFQKICETYGLTQAKDYQKLYAQYSDMVSCSTKQVDYVISLNPYDYLTMSFGVNWTSCHNIDKENRRNIGRSYGGSYCGGTMSYMLDKTSIITFTIERGSNPQQTDKITREMFHYQDGTLVQSRIYPQGNDGCTDLYTEYLGWMQEEMINLLGLQNNNWYEVKRRSFESHGVHYRDYGNSANINVVRPADLDLKSEIEIEIGHAGICPKCGRETTQSGFLVHTDCYY